MGGRAVLSDDDEENENEAASSRAVHNVGNYEDDEEGPDEYEKDGFIVDDDDEEQGVEEEEPHRMKKKKRRVSEINYVLDEEDYQLLQDNNVAGFPRPEPSSTFKRLKKAGKGSGLISDEEEFDRSSKGRRMAEEKLKRSLFGDYEAATPEDIMEEEEEQLEDEIGEDDDDMTDFIVEDDYEEDNVVRRKTVYKRMKQTPHISSSALQQAHEVFGNADELISIHREGLIVDQSEKALEDGFEPFFLSEKYLMPKDDRIRDTDIPERIQLSEEVTGRPPSANMSLAEESTWIYNLLTSAGTNSPLPGMDAIVKEINKVEIGNVLTMMHVQKYEIPFIATYRKELCASLLKHPEDLQEGEEKMPKMRWHKMLWAIQTLDRKWLLLQKRKSALQLYYNNRFEEEAQRIFDETRLALNRQLFESVVDALKAAKSEREVEDVDAKFNLHFPPGEVETEGQFKRPKQKSSYSICHEAGLWEVANKFSINSHKSGLIFTFEEVKLDDVQDAKETLEEVAAKFTCQMFETPQDVLKGARHMAAVEIGCEPIVRKHVRTVFMENAVVSTSPTPEGNLTIDSYHQLSGVKWLHNKPISEFKDAQWLLIQKAEEEKLLQVTIKLPEASQNKLLADANESYLSEYVSKSAQLWNEQRKMILDDSFFTYILPSMEKEARSLLTSRSKNWLLMEYGKQLWDKVSVAPYQRTDKDSENDVEDEPGTRVLACCWGPGKPATTFVMLDSAGEMVDLLYAGSICVRSQGVAEQQRKKNDQQRLLKFMINHQPQVVCLGAASLSCRQLKDDIYEVIVKIMEDHPGEISQDINMTIIDESLPRLYENSKVSSNQLPGQPGIVNRAVGLGRCLQNPLAMVATLCGPGKEILSWKLCPLEHFLTPDEKYEMVEQVMVDATNQIGVDINLAASHEWLFAPLQFVSGLGPRKASVLQKAFVRTGSISNRKEIPMGKIVKKVVFINAAGFLRVRRSGATVATSHFMDLLDDSRIHPESYELAKTLAKDVLGEDPAHGSSEIDDDAQQMAIVHIRERPEMLKAFDIDEYAKSYFKRFGVNKRETLYDIKMELLCGFQDWRFPFRDLNPEEEFSLLSGETEETISEGRIVQVTVRKIQENRIICALDSGLTAFVMADDYDDYNPENIQFREGAILTGKIKNVNKSRFLVYLTCKERELSRSTLDVHTLDPYYHEEKSLCNEQEKPHKEKEIVKKHCKPRMIVHRCFQNLTADEAMKCLSEKDAGESLIHPSSKGPSFLTLTLKVCDGVYAHKDIAEGEKDLKDMTSFLRLGKTLNIDEEAFEDLDEVMNKYVDPLVSHLKSMLGYHKFKRGTKTEVDDLLKAEKAENPTKIVYFFGISHEHPGTFILSYIRSSNPRHEYIGLSPKGFRFRKNNFGHIDHLVGFFQRNIDQLPSDALKSRAQISAVVPMNSTGWASGEGSVGGDTARSNEGWKGNSNSDWGRLSTPGSRTGGGSDYRSNGGGRGSHPSGIPWPTRGRGSGNDANTKGQDYVFGSSKWSSGSKEENGPSSFPSAKLQNSSGSGSGDAVGWDGGCGAGNAADNWGNGGDAGRRDSCGGWGGGNNTGFAGNGRDDGWGSAGDTGRGGRGGRGERGGRDGRWSGGGAGTDSGDGLGSAGGTGWGGWGGRDGGWRGGGAGTDSEVGQGSAGDTGRGGRGGRNGGWGGGGAGTDGGDGWGSAGGDTRWGDRGGRDGGWGGGGAGTDSGDGWGNAGDTGRGGRGGRDGGWGGGGAGADGGNGWGSAGDTGRGDRGGRGGRSGGWGGGGAGTGGGDGRGSAGDTGCGGRGGRGGWVGNGAGTNGGDGRGSAGDTGRGGRGGRGSRDGGWGGGGAGTGSGDGWGSAGDTRRGGWVGRGERGGRNAGWGGRGNGGGAGKDNGDGGWGGGGAGTGSGDGWGSAGDTRRGGWVGRGERGGRNAGWGGRGNGGGAGKDNGDGGWGGGGAGTGSGDGWGSAGDTRREGWVGRGERGGRNAGWGGRGNGGDAGKDNGDSWGSAGDTERGRQGGRGRRGGRDDRWGGRGGRVGRDGGWGGGDNGGGAGKDGDDGWGISGDTERGRRGGRGGRGGRDGGWGGRGAGRDSGAGNGRGAWGGGNGGGTASWSEGGNEGGVASWDGTSGGGNIGWCGSGDNIGSAGRGSGWGGDSMAAPKTPVSNGKDDGNTGWGSGW